MKATFSDRVILDTNCAAVDDACFGARAAGERHEQELFKEGRAPEGVASATEPATTIEHAMRTRGAMPRRGALARVGLGWKRLAVTGRNTRRPTTNQSDGIARRLG